MRVLALLPVASIVVPVAATAPIGRAVRVAKVQIDAWATVVAVQAKAIGPVAPIALVAMPMAPLTIVYAFDTAR